jgi:hypothetical protein
MSCILRFSFVLWWNLVIPIHLNRGVSLCNPDLFIYCPSHSCHQCPSHHSWHQSLEVALDTIFLLREKNVRTATRSLCAS